MSSGRSAATPAASNTSRRSLEVKTGAATVYVPAIKAEFDKTRADQPVPLKEWTVAVAEKPPVVTFTLTPGTGATADPGGLLFVPSRQLKYELPKVSRDGGKVIVTATREDEKTEPIQGFFYAPKGWLVPEDRKRSPFPPIGPWQPPQPPVIPANRAM